jgi:branched-chain amino acid transport system substrate-binding protein
VRDEKHLAVLDMAQGRVGEVLSNFFHVRLSPEVQVNRLVERAVSQGTKSIGIFYPKNSYGEAMASAFESALIARGGRVPARQSYAVTDESFEGAIRQLKLNVSYFAGSGANGFQALFIPDSNTRVKKMLKPLSDQNMTGIPLIGTNAWSGSPLSADLELLFPGSYFSDVFYAGDASPSSQHFVKVFTRAYGRTPTSLEAMAYDLIRAVNQALKQGGGKNRKSLREALSELKTYKGATTLQGFDGAGEARFQIYLLTQENGEWKRL